MQKRVEEKYKSPTHYILAGLMPFTEANIKLSFKPNLFFNDLERLDRIKEYKDSYKPTKSSVRSAYYRVVKKGLVEIDDDGIPKLTNDGLKTLKKFSSKRLNNSLLMVIFDIPEFDRKKRDRLRTILKELEFKQAQKSVWISSFDSREYLWLELKDQNLEKYVQIFESRKLEK